MLTESERRGERHEHRMAVFLAVFLALELTPSYGREAEKPRRGTIMAAYCYVREVTDQDWHLCLVGEIPSLCGVYVVIHDVAGKLLHHGVVPHGTYPPDRPHLVTIERDGATGDYRIVMLGTQRDKLGVTAPWTDLPYEVFGGGNFTIGRSGRVQFKAPEGVTKMHLGAFKGHLKVLDKERKVVADTRETGKKHGKHHNAVEFEVTPGEPYILATGNYFRLYAF